MTKQTQITAQFTLTLQLMFDIDNEGWDITARIDTDNGLHESSNLTNGFDTTPPTIKDCKDCFNELMGYLKEYMKEDK